MQGKQAKRGIALKGKGGLVMVGILVILGLVVWLDRQHGRPREPNTDPQAGFFVGLYPDDVTKLEIKGSKDPFTLEKRGDQWRLVAPVRAPAANQKVQDDLKTLLESGISDYLPDRQPAKVLKDFGLDKPTLEYVFNGGQSTLQIGSQARLNAGFHARDSRDQRVFVLPTAAAELFKNKKADDYRDRRVLALDDSDKVSSVTIDGTKGKVTLKRRGQSEWEMTQPSATAAEGGEVHSLLSQLKDVVQASSFITDGAKDLARYGLDKPRLTISITDDKGVHTLRIGGETPDKDPKIYAYRSGEPDVMVLERSAFAALDQGPANFYTREMLGFETSKAESISVQSPAGGYDLRKRGNDWWLTRPTAVKADQTRVQNLLSALAAPAFKFVEAKPADLARFGLATPPIQVTIQVSGEPTLKYFVGSQVPGGTGSEKNFYARTSKSPAVYEIADYTYQDINQKPDDFKGK